MLSYPFPPAMSGGVFRILRFCRYLPQFGWEPIVLTPRPGAVHPITIDASLDALVPPELEVHRTAVLRPVVHAKARVRAARQSLRGAKPQSLRNSPATEASLPPAAADSSGAVGQGGMRAWLRSWEGRLLANPDRHIGWLLPAVRAGLKIVRSRRPHLIYSTGPPHSTHLIAIALKRLTGLPVVLDFRDPWAAREWVAAGGPTPQQRSAMRWEARCVRAADRVILNTAAVERQFRETYPQDADKFVTIPNGIDAAFTQRIESLVAETSGRAQPGIRLCHAGSVYGKRDLRPLAVALDRVAASGQDVVMEQIGPVDPRRQPEDTTATGGGRLQLLGALPHAETLARMAAANILVMIQPDNTLQIPGKLYEMLPFRKPILTLTGRGATAEVVEQYGLGPVVAPHDPDAIAEGILSASSAAGRQSIAAGIEQALNAFDGRTLSGRLAEQFHAVGLHS
ncbi:MAG: glycosyltransferase [Pirellulales bacterium]|nr:glycosyltransferase [Pirellulales bacterium]